ncbi:hypothetical protein UG46_17425 [Pseudomonas fluorescens]|uniref:DUF262 domain-containing protein n=1 Tax=Pseudomonas fluorescens group TaxID=136843 RepID=UPI0005E1B7B0|nr:MULTISPECIES: DUF262 domain-containing protein [Pseudomonas fluorescens group]KJH85496.1 hypothetical protein UG46_17425 [Pseudomonas fluorescens]RTY63898.1 DUF262 domain-containing protein [Pseudomonas veronii]
MDSIAIQSQLDANRRSVSFDSYDVTVRQLYDMISEDIIDVTPEYQRHFVWSQERQSQLIESILLGIPVPSLFMATNKDSTWEVIDGLQRLTTLVNFIGNIDIIRKISEDCKPLELKGLEKLDSLNGLEFGKIPKPIQLMFMTRPIRITVLNDRSDFNLRFDLFERLNTGGVILHPQEIRNCVYLGPFNNFIRECSKFPAFKRSVKVGSNAEKNGNMEELVLKFFAYYENRNLFVHSVKGFLNEYMAQKTEKHANLKPLKTLFETTFTLLEKILPDGIVRSNRKNTTPLILFEAVAIGVADALSSGKVVDAQKLKTLLDDKKLTALTTGATNSRKKLVDRIKYVKDNI